MSSYNAVGMSKWDLDTPVLCADLDKLERNIQRMASTFKKAGVNWRPHTKGMKIPAVAHMLLDAGAKGVTCSKLGEAELLAQSGIKDILIVNQIVTAPKIERLASLQQFAKVAVSVDCEENVAALDAAAAAHGVRIDVAIEVNMGINRAGVEPGQPVVDLAGTIQKYKNVKFLGMLGWEGSSRAKHATDEERRADVLAGVSLLTGSADLTRKAGIPVEMVCCSGTMTYKYAAFIPGLTDVKAGGGIWSDHYYIDKGHVDHEYALTVMSSVTSRPTSTRVITDAGRKTMSFDMADPTPVGFEYTGPIFLSSEHGQFDLAVPSASPKLTEKVEWLVGYSDTTVFLHDELYGIRNDKVEVIWPILGRYKLR